MTRKVYRKIDGEWQWTFPNQSGPTESVAAAVHQDTLKQPLRHMVTGEITDSRSRLAELDRQTGCVCIGTEKLSEQRHQVRDRLTDERIMDGIARAEAIHDDPSKRRGREYENQERLDRFRRLGHADC